MDLTKDFGISREIYELFKECEEQVKPAFKKIEEIAEKNQWKVMKAFADNRVSESHFAPTYGYGYDDLGRDTLDKVYADIFDCEDALVRHQLISGTHTLSTVLFGILRPGDILFSVTGRPYDTLEEVIGIAGEDGNGSLKDFGVEYIEAALLPTGEPDYSEIEKILKEKKVKLVTIQRSKGYGTRPTYSAEKIGEIVSFVKNISPDTICMVDNCYGEFVDEKEPTSYGADIICGSLIKNPGGGIAPTGGYIAGKADLIEKCAYRLTSVGIGKEAGASLGFNKSAYQGLFIAPHVVSCAVKSAVLAACVFEKLGFETEPKWNEERHDIIEAIKLGTPENLCAFCAGVQKGAPVDSFVTPEPWAMPGYQDEVIMAAGAFNQGSSIELSADGPLREPYIGYLQGGITYESAKLGLMVAAQNIVDLRG